MFGGIGSGFTPPKYGIALAWSSMIFVVPPPRSRRKYPQAQPKSGSHTMRVPGTAECVEVEELGDAREVVGRRIESLE